MADRAVFDFYLDLLARVVSSRGGDVRVALAPYEAAAARQGAAPPAMTALGPILTGAGGTALSQGGGEIVPVPAGLGSPGSR